MRLPDGRRIGRRFHKACSLGTVKDWVGSELAILAEQATEQEPSDSSSGPHAQAAALLSSDFDLVKSPSYLDLFNWFCSF